MALADYKPPTVEIKCPDGSTFDVRALSLEDLSSVINMNRDAAESVVERCIRFAETQTNEMLVETVIQAISETPMLLATVIAHAADDAENWQAARKLPLTVSIEALERIAELTFTDIATVKKFYASATSLIRGALPPEMRIALASAA